MIHVACTGYQSLDNITRSILYQDSMIYLQVILLMAEIRIISFGHPVVRGVQALLNW